MTAQTRQTRPRAARDLGPEPRFDWLPIDSLTVNRDYQRELNTRSGRSLVARIGERFSWAAFAPIVVAPDGTGRYEILDGQHRWWAATTIPEISRVPCWIVAMESAAAAAAAFVAINRDRINLDQYARFKAEILAGEPSALAVKRVCDAARVIIPYHTIQAGQMAPRQTLALGAVRTLISKWGEAHAVRVLTLVADAAGDRPGEIRSEAVKGVSWALCQPKGAGLGDDEVAAWLRKETNANRLGRARDLVAQGRAPVTFVAFGRLLLAGLGRLAPDGAPPPAAATAKRILDRFPAVPAPGRYEPGPLPGRLGPPPERLPKKVNRRCACGAVFATDRVDETACPDCRERA
jgi:hypothetical protein